MRYFEVVKGWEDKNINLPKRSTKASYAYDIEAAEDFVIPSIWKSLFTDNVFKKPSERESLFKPSLVPTGVKVKMNEDEVFKIYVRSSSSIKKCLIMPNSVGLIDADYFGNPNNDGHIMIPLWNFGIFDYHVKKGERIAQGAFQKFLTTTDENKEYLVSRIGGFGSTGDTAIV